MNIADPRSPLRPAATLSSVPEIWNSLWNRIRNSPQSQCLIDINPRLRAVDVNVGSVRHVSHLSLEDNSSGPSWADWEKREQQKFEIRLSERDDEAKAGIATVKCVELEALRARLGHGIPLNHYQEVQLEVVTDRALNGPASERRPSFVMDPEMVRPTNLPFPGD